MRHYITVFTKTDAGGWRAVFPDFPDCEATGESLDATTVSAVLALAQHAHDRGLPLPHPSNLSDVQRGMDWIAGTIVSVVPLNGFDDPKDSTP